MPYCPNCGFEVEREAAECAKCGALFGQGGWSPVDTPIEGPPPNHSDDGTTRNLWIAAFLSVIAAFGLHEYDCHVGTSEACLWSTGFVWFYWLGIFIFVGIPAALIVTGYQKTKSSDK